MAESKKVRAVGIAVSCALSGDRPRAAAIEKAMSEAVTAALADGVSLKDSDEIKKRMMAAREKVKEDFLKAVKP